MEKVTGFIYQSTDNYSQGYSFFASPSMEEYGYIKVCAHDIEFDIPADFHPAKAEAEMLEKKLEDLNEKHSKQVMVIKKRIADLLCLEA